MDIPVRFDVHKNNVVAYGKNSIKNQNQIVEAAARVIEKCFNGNIYFIGRSPEYIYDYLRSALKDLKAWRDRCRLVIISTAKAPGYMDLTEEARDGLKTYLEKEGLSPGNIIRGRKRTCLVDFLFSGRTITVLVNFLFNWCIELKLNRQDLLYKIDAIMFITRSDKERLRRISVMDLFPNAFWINSCGFGQRSFFPVSVDDEFWFECAENEPKITDSYTHTEWGDEGV
jgi:hypothetical protein